MYTIEYRHINSGGFWWLARKDWKRLEESGWELEKSASLWGIASKHSLPQVATITTSNPLGAIESWKKAVHSCRLTDRGCPCCDEPHSFIVTDERGGWFPLYGSYVEDALLSILSREK